MKAGYDGRIDRATELAQTYPGARDLLRFYRELTVFQKPIFENLQRTPETGVETLLPHFPALLALIRRLGPAPLAAFAANELAQVDAQRALLHECWGSSAHQSPAVPEALFFARVLLQPFAESLASADSIEVQVAAGVCPFCGGRPVAGVLRGEGDGAKRWLQCSLCSTEWEYRRVVCPNCGEENKDKLPIYTASEFDHVRLDACDVCKTYIKSVDLTRDGRAVPVVDELATVALNVWAEEHGYAKLETNLLGL